MVHARDEGRDRRRRRAPLRRRATRTSSSSTCWRAGSSTTLPRPSITPRRARSCSTSRRSRRSATAWRSASARTDEATRARSCAPLRDLVVDVDPEPGYEPPPLPEDLVRPWLLPAVYERLRTGRGEFLAELRPAIPVFLRFGGIDYDNDDDAIHEARRVRASRPAGAERVRRQRPAADARRQGRLPLRRVRVSARPRGRRRPGRRRGARAPGPREDDGRARDPGRHDARAPPQRDVRPRDAPHVRVPRRRREPRRPPDVGGAARSDLRRARRSGRPPATRSSGSACRT